LREYCIKVELIYFDSNFIYHDADTLRAVFVNARAASQARRRLWSAGCGGVKNARGGLRAGAAKPTIGAPAFTRR
jgi:hypothetical protein